MTRRTALPAPQPDVTLVIPVYNPGTRIERTLASVRAQTLGTRLEVILVDDGSTDGTPERLAAVVREDPRFRLECIPNSGWPSRPRNRGIELARGRYVLFLDHDDELGSEDALAEAVAYADVHGADVVVGKEISVGGPVLNTDMWRGDSPAADLLDDGCLDLLTVHRLFRTKLLREHDIRFPERKGLLEDHPFAMHAYLAAERIAVLASRPLYRWIVERGTGANNSSKQIAMDAYFGNVEHSLDLVEQYLPPGGRRDRILVRWLATSLATSVGPRLFREPVEYQQEWVQRAGRLVTDRYHPRFDTMLPPARRLRIQLLRAGDLAALEALAGWEEGITTRPETASAAWVDGTLELRTRATLVRHDESLRLERRAGRLVWPLPAELHGHVAGDALDVTDSLAATAAELTVRDRNSRVEWYVPSTSELELVEDADGLTVVVHCESRLDPRTVALGAPLDEGLWDLRMRTRALGYESQPRLVGQGVPAAAALADGVAQVLYRTVDERLSIDVGQNKRSVVSSAHPRAGDVTAAAGRLTIDLPRLDVAGQVRLPATVRLTSRAEGAEPVLWEGELDAPRRGSARLTARGQVPPGRYRVHADVGGRSAKLSLELHVPEQGAPWALAPTTPSPQPPRLPEPPVRPTRAALRRIPRILRGRRIAVGKGGTAPAEPATHQPCRNASSRS